MKMTQEDYIKNEGVKCPYCESGGVVSTELFDMADLKQPIRCVVCNKEWVDHYALIGYEEL